MGHFPKSRKKAIKELLFEPLHFSDSCFAQSYQFLALWKITKVLAAQNVMCSSNPLIFNIFYRMAQEEQQKGMSFTLKMQSLMKVAK